MIFHDFGDIFRHKINGKLTENAARPTGTLKIMLTSFRFIRSLGISLLNFLTLYGFLRTVHDTLNMGGWLDLGAVLCHHGKK